MSKESLSFQVSGTIAQVVSNINVSVLAYRVSGPFVHELPLSLSRSKRRLSITLPQLGDYYTSHGPWSHSFKNSIAEPKIFDESICLT